VGVGLNRDGEMAAETQIGNFDEWMSGGVIDEHVLRFQVTMHDAEFVHVSDTLDKLVHDALDEHRI